MDQFMRFLALAAFGAAALVALDVAAEDGRNVLAAAALGLFGGMALYFVTRRH